MYALYIMIVLSPPPLFLFFHIPFIHIQAKLTVLYVMNVYEVAQTVRVKKKDECSLVNVFLVFLMYTAAGH